MPLSKTTNNKAAKRNGVSGRRHRKGVCMMCAAHTNVSHVVEFDDQLLCDACSEDTALLSRYLQSDQDTGDAAGDDFFDDDPIF